MSVIQCVKKYVHYASVAIILKMTCDLLPGTAFYYFSCTANFILYVMLATVTYNFCKHMYNNERVEADNKAVLITGCSTGFGNRLAMKLDSEGFQVFATCRSPDCKGARELKESCSDRLHILYLDVTKDETVEKAVQFVKDNLGSNAFWAVVNNAGTAKGFSTDFSSIDDFKDTIDVNALGPVRVTKAFLPLLKKSKGRVVNVNSIASRFSFLDACAYTTSKYAAVGFTEMLSLEMKVWGVHAISIEPEFFRTPINDPELICKRMEAERRKIPTDILSSYGEEYLENLKKVIAKLASQGCSDIDIVVDTIVTAITQKFPDHVFRPCRNIIVRIIFSVLLIMPFDLFEQCLHINKKILGYPIPKDIIKYKMRNL